jgi:nucleotide-binding universal stress UspA family protein
MASTNVDTRIPLNNILFLTDFSEPSRLALPFAAAIARAFGCKVHVLHILIPQLHRIHEFAAEEVLAEEECAQKDMRQLAGDLADVPHERLIEREVAVWPAVERVVKSRGIDLIVLGTHGRSGISRLLLGSVAEEIFRRATDQPEFLYHGE